MQNASSPLQGASLAQIGIIVPNIEAAVAAWAAILGVAEPKIITTDPVEQAQTEYHGRPTPARAKLAFFQIGPLALELIEPLDGPSTWQEQLDSHGPSLHHLAFEIQGMAGQVAAFGAHGLRLIQRGEYTGGRYAYLDGVQQLGTVVELLENDRGGK